MEESKLLEAIENLIDEKLEKKFEENLAPTNTRLDNIEKNQDQMQGDIKTMQQDIKVINQKISSLENNQTSLNQKMDSLENNQTSLNQKMDSLENNQRIYNQRLTLFENDTSKKLSLIWEGIKNIKERFDRQDKLESKVENHDDRIFALECAIKK